jgi:hypothetical protein
MSNTQIEETSPREMHLANHPELKKVQNANIDGFNRFFAAGCQIMRLSVKQKIEGINTLRHAGQFLLNIAIDLPGKDITENFHRQLSTRGQKKLAASFEQVEACLHLARCLKEEITTAEQAKKAEQYIFVMLGESKKARQQQMASLPPDSISILSNWLEDEHALDSIPDWRTNEHYFVNGHLRDDLRQNYAEKLLPLIKQRIPDAESKVEYLKWLEKELTV